MCGICGAVSVSGRPVEEHPVRGMLRAMTHRGPDSEGLLTAPGIVAGMRRLSVIDLHGGDQPIANEDGRVSVVFNGEIYNFRELRAELERAGHAFATASDTEVLVHLWEEDGPELLSRLDGMFAFCLHDARSGTTFLARDRIGIKPLFLAEEGGQLLFASEMRVLLAHPEVPRDVDRGALAELLAFQFVDGGRTIRSRVRALRPGHYVLIEDGEIEERQWYELPVPSPSVTMSLEESARELEGLVERAITTRTVADVPLGVFLSGGLDSSIVTSVLASASDHRVQTFSIGFDGPASHDEREQAQLVSRHFGTEHHELLVTADDVARLLPQAIRHLAAPVTDPALLPTWSLARHARRRVTVVLTGEGADELFGGYRRYALHDRFSGFARVPGAAAIARSALAQRLPGRSGQALAALTERDLARAHAAWSTILDSPTLARLLGPAAERGLRESAAALARSRFAKREREAPLGARSRADLAGWIPGLLLEKVDRATMAHSLEARVPFLSHDVVAFAAGLPDAHRIARGETKRVLRAAFADAVPASVLRRPKRGFDLPLDAWLRGPLRGEAERVLVPRVLALWPEVDGARVTGLLGEHLAGRRNAGLALFLLLSIFLFLESDA